MVLSTHMLAGSKQEWKTDEFGFIHLNNAFTYNIEALVHAKKNFIHFAHCEHMPLLPRHQNKNACFTDSKQLLFKIKKFLWFTYHCCKSNAWVMSYIYVWIIESLVNVTVFPSDKFQLACLIAHSLNTANSIFFTKR